MSNPINLTNWCIKPQPPSNPYMAPELATPVLGGYVVSDGKLLVITYDMVLHIDGRELTLRDGRIIHLGDVEDGYHDWLKEHRPSWNEEDPIKGTLLPKDE